MRRFALLCTVALMSSAGVASAMTDAEFQAYIDQINTQAKSVKPQSQATPPVAKTPTSQTPPASTAPVVVSPNSTRTLSRGMRGPDVTLIQRSLIGLGLLASDSATGFYGALTEAAVKRFQVKNGIVTSGSPSTTGYGAVGPKTRAALKGGAIDTPVMTLDQKKALLAQLMTLAGLASTTASKSGTSQQPSTIAPTLGGGSGASTGGGSTGGGSTVPQPVTTPSFRSCTLNGITVEHAASKTFYSQSSITSGACSAIAQERTCTDGVLGGPAAYQYGSCAVSPVNTCSFGGMPVNSGVSITAYQSATVPFGQTCVSQQRVCTNGALSGSYQYGACAVSPAVGCTWNGSAMQSGTSVTAYQSATVPSGSQCSSQQRMCTNGTLSGSYSFSACTVSPPAIVVTTIKANPATQKPYMGFNTYYANRIGKFQVNQNTLSQISDDMKTSGMTAAGYSLLGFDIGWWYSTSNTPRDPSTHTIIPSPLITDLPALITQIHGNGQIVGAYTDPGIGDTAGCGGFPGSGGYIDQDVRQFVSWGFDFLKLDHCGGNPHAASAGITDPMAASAYEYGLWSTAILSAARALGKQLVFNIGDFDGISNRSPSYASSLGNSWRTQTDIANPPDFPITWHYVVRSFVGNDVPPAAGPGHWNDPDYLLIGGFGLSATEEQSQFNMWSIQAAPLVLATYPGDLKANTTEGARLRAMLLNPEVIAIDQDALGRQGEKVREDVPGQVVYAKMLSGPGRRAVLLLNQNNSTAASITVYWGDLGLAAGSASVRDVVSQTDLGSQTNSFTVSNVPAHGSRLLVIQGSDAAAGSGSWQSQSIKILGGPSIVQNGSTVIAAALGIDRYYWVKGISGSGISTWTRVKPASCGSDVIFFGDPTLLVANNAISIFGTGYIDSPRGQSIDSLRVYQAYSYDNGVTWSCYGDLGQPGSGVRDRLAAASTDGASIDLFARGTDNAVWYKRYTASGGWGQWSSAGACVHSGISASTRQNGVVDIVALGCDNKVWQGWYTTSPNAIAWGQVPSTAVFSGTPTSIWNNALGHFIVYATATDGHDVRTTHWDGVNGWSSWTSLGGCAKGGIAASGVSPTNLIATACNTPGTNADTDFIGDSPIYLSN